TRRVLRFPSLKVHQLRGAVSGRSNRAGHAVAKALVAKEQAQRMTKARHRPARALTQGGKRVPGIQQDVPGSLPTIAAIGDGFVAVVPREHALPSGYVKCSKLS